MWNYVISCIKYTYQYIYTMGTDKADDDSAQRAGSQAGVLEGGRHRQDTGAEGGLEKVDQGANSAVEQNMIF